MGRKVPEHCEELAPALGPGDPVFRLLGTDPAGDLHDQRHREFKQHGATSGQEQGPFSARRRGEETHLSGVTRGGR